jgi:glyoxylase-like metal-dependent hydrolase (beta-lactamase superfamily II)
MTKIIVSVAYAGLILFLYACSPQDNGQPSAVSMTDATPQESIQTGAPSREIVHIAGDLYRVQNDFHFTVFLVTSEGIILADPINADVATWLKAELAQQFGVPVRYVLYSHYHWDHASGARVFADTATLVGHANMSIALESAIAGFPVQVSLVDSDGDQQLSRDEATGELLQAFSGLDTNSDGYLTAAEILAEVLPPEMVYSERLTITLGGKSVELIHPGPNHSIDASVLLFPEERAIYGVDFINVKRLALGFPGSGTLSEWISSLKQVEALDFDIVTPGHSSVGTKAEFTAYREFFEDLQVAVTDAVNSGMTLEELLASDVLTDYSDLPNYVPQRDRNIEEAYGLVLQQD